MAGIQIDADENISEIGYIELNDVVEPANPADGQGYLYKKIGNDGLFWKPDSSGQEIDLTSGVSNANIPVIEVEDVGPDSSSNIPTTIARTITAPAAGTYLAFGNVSVNTSGTLNVNKLSQFYVGGVSVGQPGIIRLDMPDIGDGLEMVHTISEILVVNGSQDIEFILDNISTSRFDRVEIILIKIA